MKLSVKWLETIQRVQKAEGDDLRDRRVEQVRKQDSVIRRQKVGLPSLQRMCYPGDNRLITPRVHIDGVVWHPDGLHRILGLEARPWGLGCSPIKAVRELGSERRDSSSPIWRGRRYLRGAAQYERCTGGLASGVSVELSLHGRVAKPGRINAEGI